MLNRVNLQALETKDVLASQKELIFSQKRVEPHRT